MSGAVTQLGVIEQTMGWEPRVWLFGGFAEDAVLDGFPTRPHVDIDLLAFRDDLPTLLDHASAIGFDRFGVRWHTRDGRPLAAGSVVDGIDLEFCVADRIEGDGKPFFEFPASSGSIRMWLPEGALDYPDQRLDGVAVRTVSPLALFQTREVLGGVFGGLRPKDVLAQKALRERFFGDVEDAELAAHTEPI